MKKQNGGRFISNGRRFFISTSRLRFELKSKAPQASRISTTLPGHAENHEWLIKNINLIIGMMKREDVKTVPE